MTKVGETCSDTNLVSIMDEDECKMVIKALGLNHEEYKETSSFPTGCYINNDMYPYFNEHQSGSGAFNAQAICKTK